MSEFSAEQRITELMEAACKGMNDMFKTTRGANVFGSNAKAIIEDERIKVITKDGDFWMAI